MLNLLRPSREFWGRISTAEKIFSRCWASKAFLQRLQCQCPAARKIFGDFGSGKQSWAWFHFPIKESNLNSLNKLSLMFHKFHSDNPEYSFLKFYTLKEYQGKLYIRSVIIANYLRHFIIMNCKSVSFSVRGYFGSFCEGVKCSKIKCDFIIIKFWVEFNYFC